MRGVRYRFAPSQLSKIGKSELLVFEVAFAF
jgi:hypothetical protein